MLKTIRPRSRKHATARGITTHGGGSVAYVPVPPTWQGTTRQVCGMWPFIAPGSLPHVGGPIGRHQESHVVVCFDHISWFLAKFIANPSVVIIAQPGMGKSTLTGMLMTNLAAMGYILLIPGDTKPDYTELVNQLDGEVRSVRRTGGSPFNPCDPGGMVTAAYRIATVPGMEAEATALRGEAIGRATTLIGGLLELSRKQPVRDYEESAISASLDALYTRNGQVPVLADLIDYITMKPRDLQEELVAVISGDGDTWKYDELTLPLIRSLKAVVGGKFGDTFSRRTIRRDAPVALDIDTSAIKAGDPAYLGAVLMAAWADVYGQVEAEQALADAGLAERRRYCLTLDELWRVLNLGGSLPDRVNELTRLNRTQGVGQIMVTHSMRDLTGTGKSTTDGIADRAGAVIIGGVPKSEMDALQGRVTLTKREQQSLTQWWSASQGTFSEPNTIPPGAGKFLIKPSADDPGIPVDVILGSVEVEWGGQDTNRAWTR